MDQTTFCPIEISSRYFYSKRKSVGLLTIHKKDSLGAFMDMRILVCKICLLLLTIQLNAQDSIPRQNSFESRSVGIGVGLDYGGLGINLVIYPYDRIGFFGGIGYALGNLGYNAGVKFRLASVTSNAMIHPYILAMYGYNASIHVSNAPDYNKVFCGPTFGVGLDFRLNKNKKSYLTFALLLPIRNSHVNDYINELKKNHSIQFNNNHLPLIGISIGWRFIREPR